MMMMIDSSFDPPSHLRSLQPAPTFDEFTSHRPTTDASQQNLFTSNDATRLTMTTTVEVNGKTGQSSATRKRQLHEINADEQKDQQGRATTKTKKKARLSKLDEESSVLISCADTLRTKRNGSSIDQSSGTDESSFGSCEPGTNVVLQGIVWNETDKGVLVVNITWRGKTYVGALLNTTEQNWAPPRYRPSTKPPRDLQVNVTPSSQTSVRRASSHEPSERILRNGKRRGTDAAVTSKASSFKVPPKPHSSKADELSSSVKEEDDDSISEEKLPTNNAEDEGCSSRSLSPTTSARSSNSSPSTSLPVDRSTKMEDPSLSYHSPNAKLFPSSSNLSMYFPTAGAPSSYLHGSATDHPFNLSAYHLPLSSPLYFNSSR